MDGIIYSTSNSTATFTATNAAGCDSVITLHLTILNATSSTDILDACETFTWINGITYTSSNDSATHVIINMAGCDSVITLNLTIHNSYVNTDSVTTCAGYTWINGNTYSTSGVYADTTITAFGCDSITFLVLTIANLNLAIYQATPGVLEVAETGAISYQWVDCATELAINGATSQVFNATQNGSYKVIVTTANCMDTWLCVTVSELGLSEMTLSEWTIFPNPSTKNIQFIGLEKMGQLKNIELYDSKGTIMESFDKATSSIDVSNFAHGIYFIRLESDKGISVQRFVKE